MTARTRWFVVASALALFPVAAFGQAGQAVYEVKRGDTLFGIARQLRPEGVTLHQMVLALYRSNPDAFTAGNINQLRAGAMLQLPDKAVAMGVEPADAARQLAALAAVRPVVPAPAAAVPGAAPTAAPVAAIPPPRPSARPPLGKDEAERRYRAGLAMERAGDDRGALQAFLDAGESGHGQAQKRLGEIYDRGNSAVARDYETALRWYQKAREQGVAVPKPETRAPAIR